MVAPLLAKSKSRPQIDMEITLTGHTKCVLWAIDALFGGKDSPTLLAKSWLRFFGLAEEDFPRFRRHLRVAAAAHDWGKANDGFQNMVEKTGEQVVRHEHLSGLLLADMIADEAVSAWMKDAGIDPSIVLAAVLCHHVKAGAGHAPRSEPVGMREWSGYFCSDHPTSRRSGG